MVHQLKTIAQNFRLDVAKLKEYATKPENVRRFGIFIENDQPCTTTWYTNELVEAFEKEIQE